ncbi:hypothetical protein [Nostoc sp.]|uniref:hypothetical protein n=1 Tax=Nostoc sp. TaxID=1180 RepID=UPI002FF45A74
MGITHYLLLIYLFPGGHGSQQISYFQLKLTPMHDGKQTAEGNKDDTGTVKWTIDKTVQQIRSSHVGKVTSLVFIPDSHSTC